VCGSNKHIPLSSQNVNFSIKIEQPSPIVIFLTFKISKVSFQSQKKLLTGLKTVRIACNTGKKDKEQHSFETGRKKNKWD
jgi:hypothetical protein